jgi:hypothetical protein
VNLVKLGSDPKIDATLIENALMEANGTSKPQSPGTQCRIDYPSLLSTPLIIMQ